MPIIDIGTLNSFVGFGALLLEAASIILLIAILIRRKNKIAYEIVSFFGKWALPLGFILFLAALLMSLYYSEIYGFVPCGLCWLQRIFMYPQVILLGLAWFKGDPKIADYSIALSLGAMFIGLYQHYLQLGGSDFLPCPASGPGADCAAKILFEYGFITFPFVGASLAFFAILLMIALKISNLPPKSL